MHVTNILGIKLIGYRQPAAASGGPALAPFSLLFLFISFPCELLIIIIIITVVLIGSSS